MPKLTDVTDVTDWEGTFISDDAADADAYSESHTGFTLYIVDTCAHSDVLFSR